MKSPLAPKGSFFFVRLMFRLSPWSVDGGMSLEFDIIIVADGARVDWLDIALSDSNVESVCSRW